MSLWLLLGSAGAQHQSTICPSGSPLLIVLTLPWLTEEGNAKQPEIGCVDLTFQANLKFFCTFSRRSRRFPLDTRLMLLVSAREAGAQPLSQQFFPDSFGVFHMMLEELLRQQVMRGSLLLLSTLSPRQYMVEASRIPSLPPPCDFCPPSGPAAARSQFVSTPKASSWPPAVTAPTQVHAFTLLPSSSCCAQFVAPTFLKHQASSSQTSYNHLSWELLVPGLLCCSKSCSSASTCMLCIGCLTNPLPSQVFLFPPIGYSLTQRLLRPLLSLANCAQLSCNWVLRPLKSPSYSLTYAFFLFGSIAVIQVW